jgi:hypothetical protein
MSAIGTKRTSACALQMSDPKRTCELHPLVNENVPAVFDLIERAHAPDKCFGWHPNPVRTGGVDIENEKRVGFGVVCANWGNVRATPLAYSLA